MEVVTRERFASPTQETHALPQGLTVDEILKAVSWSDDLRPWTYVTVDGQEVPASIWSSARPKIGRRVMIHLRPAGGLGGGGGSGKQILMAVAAIAIIVVAAYAAPAIVGAYTGVGYAAASSAAITTGIGTAVALTQAGLAIAGTLALGALIRPGSVGKSTLTNSGSGGNSASESSAYGVSGASNSLSPYGVVPRVYGRHRVTPPFAAEPYVVSAGVSQTINLLLDFGYGPLLVEDLRIGNTPIQDFPTARWYIHSEFKMGDHLYIYQNDQATATVGAVLTEKVDNIRTIPQAGSVVTLEFQFPGGLVGFTDQGSSYQKDDHITIFAMPEDGSGGWQPISNFQPYAMFQGEGGVQNSGDAQIGSIGVVRWSRGTYSGLPKGFTSGDPAVLQMQVGTLFTYNGVGYTIVGITDTPNEPGDRVVELSGIPPNITWVWTNTGVIQGEEGRAGSFPLPGSPGTYGPLTVTFGPSPYDVEFHGQTRSPRTVSVVMQMPYENKWQILVRRSTPVSSSALVSNAITWASSRSGRWLAPIYPNKPRTILELQITASEQISGQIQNINALCTSILYDPTVNARVPTRTPAWIYADILVGTANPRPTTWAKLDVAKLSQWASQCEALTVQGDRFATCDLVVDYRITIGELAQNICSAGRAAPTIIDGQYSVMLEDEDKVPVQMFTNRNAEGFSSTRTWVDLPHALKVQYMSENTWNREELIVYADGYNQNNATKFESLQLAGITRPWQAWRFGRYFMAAAFLRRERMSLTSDVENLVCQRGDLVRIAHDRLLTNAVARVVNTQGAAVNIDADIDFEFSSEQFPVFPANTGNATAVPTGWGAMGLVAGATAVTWGDKGADDTREWVVATITKAAAGGTLNSTQIIPTPFLSEINSDDDISGQVTVEILETTNFVGTNIRWNFQPGTSTDGTGLGSPSVAYPFPEIGKETTLTQILKPAGPLGVTNTLRPNISFEWANTTVYPAVLRVRIYTPRHYINNRKPDLMQRTTPQNLVPNPAAEGALVGTGTGDASNVLPAGWAMVQYAGWTRSVVKVDPIWTYQDFDIRLTCPAGSAYASIAFAKSIPLPPSKVLAGNIQIRQVGVVGTPPTVNFRFTAETSAGGFIVNTVSPAIVPSTAQEARSTVFSSNFSATAGAELFSAALMFTPVSSGAVDVTYRIRLPVVTEGTADPVTTLPAVVEPDPLYVDIRNSDGELLSSVPVVAAPASDQVVLDDSVWGVLEPGDILAFGNLETETSDWLVDKITAGGDFAANIELIEYAPAVLDADKGPIPPYVPNQGSGLLTDLPPVRNLSISSALFEYTADGVPTHQNLLQWDPPSYLAAFYIITRVYEVPDPGMGTSAPYQSENILLEVGRSTAPRFVDTIDTRTLRAEGTLIRYYVAPVTAAGRRGALSDVSATFLPDTVAPPEIKFTTNVLSETTMLIWDKPSIPDLGGYQIRFVDNTYGALNPLWEDMVSVVDSVSPALTSLTVHIQTGTYGIRAFDTSGNFGPASYSVTRVETLPNVDELTRLVEGPVFSGSFNGTEVVSGSLRLKPDTNGYYPSEGWFYASSAVDYPSSWTFRVRGAFESKPYPNTSDPQNFWNVQIWVAVQKSAPKLNSSWFVPLSHAAPLAGGPGVYVPLGNVSQTDLVGRLVNWALRLVSRNPAVTPSITKAALIVDHSERREFDDDVVTGTGGLNIAFQYPFFEPPSVAITLNDGASGDRIVRSVSTTTLTVEVFSSTGTSVSRSIDWQAIGYGKGYL